MIEVTVSEASWFCLIAGVAFILYLLFFWFRNEVSPKGLGYGTLAALVFILLGIAGLIGWIQPGGAAP